jgi:2-polyprenyl-6-methoxyphenol hydroxylase-like FAD-dependent oxidoreductase
MRVGINGIGIAGPTLAYWLRQFGHEPVLFEKAPALRSGGYLIDFWGLGYEIAERMNLLPTLRRQSYEMRRMRMVDARGRDEATVDLTPMRETLGGRFISLARSDLAATIFGACNGVPTHFGVSISAVEQTGDGVLAKLSDGRNERFDLVIGADGLHSQVRAAAFGQQANVELPLGGYVAAFRVRGYPRRDELTYVSHTVPKRQAARVSLRDDETLVLLVCRADLLDGDPPRERQKAALRRAFGDMGWEVPAMLDRMEASDEVYFDRVSQIRLPHWSSGRIGLLGDAAACPSLLAGEGCGLAMAEAYVLAGEIKRAGNDVERALAAYEERLHVFVAAKQRAALRFFGFFAPKTTLGLRVRNLIVNTFSIPFVARRVVASSVSDKLELPRYGAA